MLHSFIYIVRIDHYACSAYVIALSYTIGWAIEKTSQSVENTALTIFRSLVGDLW